jgi:hypothetical protein
MLDSRSIRHIISNKVLFYTFSNYTSSIIWGDNSTISSKGIGEVIIKLSNNKQITLKNCLYILTFTINIISISQLEDSNYNINFKNKQAIISKDNSLIAIFNRSNNLY